MSLAMQSDVQALCGWNRGNRAPDPRLHESARPAYLTDSKQSPIVAVNVSHPHGCQANQRGDRSARMRFIPTNCDTASLAKSSAAGRAIAAMITRPDIPAAQDIANASTALRKLQAIAAPLRRNVDVRSQRIPRNGNISAKCNFPVRSGRPCPKIRVKLT
jgi:hypothetical protein